MRAQRSFPSHMFIRQPSLCLVALEARVQPLGQEYPLEKEMTTHFSIFAWEIPWTEELGRLQSMGHRRVRHDLATK